MSVPVSTYRLQVRRSFDLDACAGITDYLSGLGIDWLYLSPLLTAAKDSDHGYDVVDVTRVDPVRGGREGLDRLALAAKSHGLGMLIDIVPNHVGVADASENAWWWDVLQHGQESHYAEAFDIDWEFGAGRLRVPVLAGTTAEAAAAGELRIQDGELQYFDHRFPLAPGTADDDADADIVHSRQHYELIHWRRADDELNYRRFFAVNTLAGVRVEVPWVFEETHAEIVRWVREGIADGLRVDHPDGLADPGGYLDALAAATDNTHVLVEKILESGEQLPAFWATAGTTGYDALADIDRVLVDPAGRDALDALDTRLRGRAQPIDWHTLIRSTKRRVADTILRSEVLRLERLLPHPIDLADDAIAELLACFPVYRSYLPVGEGHLRVAAATAQRHRPELTSAIESLLPLLADPQQPVAIRFQQTSGMVMAKGVEDTAFYRYTRLSSLTEVGADPAEFSIDVAEFHRRQMVRQASFPASLTTLSTHDTKRGEDTRARISVLAELAAEWEQVVRNLGAHVSLGDGPLENLLWESIVGAWPASRERLHNYAEKAAREAGNSTSWSDPDSEFERRLHALVDSVFDDEAVAAILGDFVSRISGPGWCNSLTAKLIQLTAPGVPDLYQGSELWEMSLVDPDNRREVDFEVRRRYLAEVDAGALPAIDETGAAKLLVTTRALRLRRDRPELFTRYAPLPALGEAALHAVAFDRGGAVTVGDATSGHPRGTGRMGGHCRHPAGQARRRRTHRKPFRGRNSSARRSALEIPCRAPRAGDDVIASVWAPNAKRVRIRVGDEESPLEPSAGGWWRTSTSMPAGTGYGFLLDDEATPLPDPRSRRQPRGVHDLSQVFDAGEHEWQDEQWTGRQLAGGLIYELHIGTFTPTGTLDSAIERLDHLVEIGVDFVEVLPVNGFNGTHNWGYDGVLWYTVHEAYGGPPAYQRFVDACHERGLAVIQDVVHNHLGASGNYLPRYGPYLRDDSANTWGAAVNLAEPVVRRFILDNAAMWLRDYHVDGLRLDAVHALVDESEKHLLQELAEETDALSAHLGRPLTLIAESDMNEPKLIMPREAGGYGLTAQWSDDHHHAMHVALTGETAGYYADFASLAALVKTSTRGFFHDGTWSSFRGRKHGRPIDAHVPTWRLVTFIQDHDQVGNRATGDRLSASLDYDRLAIAAVLNLTSPFTPMLFMGEEWGASTPWQFFTSHPEPELGRATAEGRITEFERMGWDAEVVPDPQDPETFQRSKLDWQETESGDHARLLALYRELAALRAARLELTDPRFALLAADFSDEDGWFRLERGGVSIIVNFTDTDLALPSRAITTVLLATQPGTEVTGGRVVIPARSAAVFSDD